MENFTGNNSLYSLTFNSVNRPYFDQPANFSIPLACLYSVISFIAVFGNLLVVTAVCWNRTLRLYTSNYFLANLAVADFFQGAVSIPLRVLEVLGTQYNSNVFCRVAIPTSILFGSSSNLAILVVSIDRFLAVKYPYIYIRFATTKCIIATITFAWSVAVVLSLTAASNLVWLIPDISTRICRFPVYLNRHYIIAMYIVVHAIPIGTVVLLYGFILKASLIHVRRIHAQELAVVGGHSGAGSHGNTIEDTTSNTHGRKKTEARHCEAEKSGQDGFYNRWSFYCPCCSYHSD